MSPEDEFVCNLSRNVLCSVIACIYTHTHTLIHSYIEVRDVLRQRCVWEYFPSFLETCLSFVSRKEKETATHSDQSKTTRIV